MALRSAPALLKAIEGFRGETAGSSEHEDMNSQLARVAAEIERGHSTPQDSPGRRGAASAAAEAYQRNHPSEQAHSGGDGQVRSNEPGSAHRGEPVREVVSERQGSPSDKLSGAIAPSRGNLIAAMPAHGFSGPDSEIRRVAAERELSRPDSKFKAKEGKAGGNKESVEKAPPTRSEGRVGDVEAPGITNTQKAGEAERAGREADKQPEEKPPYAGESLEGDGWQRAAAKTKARIAMKTAAR